MAGFRSGGWEVFTPYPEVSSVTCLRSLLGFRGLDCGSRQDGARVATMSPTETGPPLAKTLRLNGIAIPVDERGSASFWSN